MALLHISYDVRWTPELMDVIKRSFDSMKFVRIKKGSSIYNDTWIYRVQRPPDIPIWDKVITPHWMKFDGVDPFIIQF